MTDHLIEKLRLGALCKEMPEAADLIERQATELEKAHEARRQAQREAADLKERMARSRIDLMRELREQGWTAPSLTVAGGKWEGAEEWMPLAWELCAEENGEEACNELIWEGGPIPEPWGDRWLKYEDQAKEMIAMVRTHVPTPQPAAQAEPVSKPALPEELGQWLTAIGELYLAMGRPKFEATEPTLGVVETLREAARRLANPPAQGTGELPPLPPYDVFGAAFSDGAMHSYARAALAQAQKEQQ